MQQTKKFNVNNHCMSGEAMSVTTAVQYFLKRHQLLKSVELFALPSKNKYFVLSCFTVC